MGREGDFGGQDQRSVALPSCAHTPGARRARRCRCFLETRALSGPGLCAGALCFRPSDVAATEVQRGGQTLHKRVVAFGGSSAGRRVTPFRWVGGRKTERTHRINELREASAMRDDPRAATDRPAPRINWSEIHGRLDRAQAALDQRATATEEEKKMTLRARAKALARELRPDGIE